MVRKENISKFKFILKQYDWLYDVCTPTLYVINKRCKNKTKNNNNKNSQDKELFFK